MFGGSTPLPLPLVNAAIASIQTLQNDKTLRRRLEFNVACVKGALSGAGIPVSAPPSPVFAIVPGTEREAEQIKKRCLAHDVFPSFIKYHGGPRNGYFRFAISSEHTKAQLDGLLESLLNQRGSKRAERTRSSKN